MSWAAPYEHAVSPDKRDWLAETDRQPSYDRTVDFSRMVETPSGKSRNVYAGPTGDIRATVGAIQDTVRDFSWQVRQLAKHLKGASLETSAFNVWHFIQVHLAYTFDPPGKEWIRTPARTWVDRKSGVDCEDYSIFAFCLLREMGYGDRLVFSIIQRFDRAWSHIYVTVQPGGINLDGPSVAVRDGASTGIALDRLTLYPAPADSIRKTMEVKVLDGLRGIENDNYDRVASRGSGSKDPVTRQLSAALVKETNPDRRSVLAYLVSLDGMPERDIVLDFAEFIKRITPEGAMEFFSGAPKNLINEYVGESLEIQGLGLFRSKAQREKFLQEKARRDAEKEAEKRRKQAEREARRNGRQDKKPGILKKIGSAVVKVFPAAVLARQSMLTILKLNGFRLASKLRLMYLSEEKARKAKLNIPEWRKLADKKSKVEKAWTNVGGDLSKLRAAIAKGARVPVSTIGEPISITAAAATAAPILVVITAILKGTNTKRITAGSPEEAALVGAEDPAMAVADFVTTVISKKRDEGQTQAIEMDETLVNTALQDLPYSPATMTVGKKPSGDGKNRTPLYIAIGGSILALIGGIAYMATREKK